jgi:hypothetical protein
VPIAGGLPSQADDPRRRLALYTVEQIADQQQTLTNPARFPAAPAGARGRRCAPFGKRGPASRPRHIRPTHSICRPCRYSFSHSAEVRPLSHSWPKAVQTWCSSGESMPCGRTCSPGTMMLSPSMTDAGRPHRRMTAARRQHRRARRQRWRHGVASGACPERWRGQGARPPNAAAVEVLDGTSPPTPGLEAASIHLRRPSVGGEGGTRYGA